MDADTQTPSLAGAAVRGALAGVAGGLALMLVEQGGRRTILPEGSDTTSTAARAAKAVAKSHDASLSSVQAEAVGGVAELAWCVALGAVFGVVHSRLRAPPLLDGLGLAALAYTATSSSRGLLPRLGMTPTLHQNVEEAAIPVSSHVAFGIATAAMFEATT